MLDASLPLTIQEYLEWGNPNEKEDYQYMKSYSPYDNIRAADYPSAGASLPQRQPGALLGGAKYVAKLRALKTDKDVVLLKPTSARPGGASGRYGRPRDTAFELRLILNQRGSTSPKDAAPTPPTNKGSHPATDGCPL